MSNLTPSATFDNVVQLETTTVALGGTGAPMNAQAQALLNRTQYLFVQISNLAPVASTGDYNSLINRPALGSAAFQNSAAFATAAQGAKADGAAQVSSLATVAFSGSYNDLLNKPPFISDAPSDGNVYGRRNGGWVVVSGAGAGTVTSVAISAPAQFNVTGSPITNAGTITLAWVNQSANRVFAGPASGSAGAPSFRALVAADLPVFGPSGSSHAAGAVPDPGATAGTTRFLREDGTWAVAAAAAPMSLPLTTVASGSGATLQYKSEPNLVYMANGNLLCVYRKGSAHQNNGGLIVGKISTDNGATWGAEFTIYNQGTYDTRNPGVGVDATSGRIVVFGRVYNVTSNANVDVFFVSSTDNGATWSSPTSLVSTLPASVDWCPFGRPQVTSLGWLMTFYQANKCYLLKSTDGGVTWTAQGYIYNLSQSAVFNEPNLIALDSSRVILILRDDGATPDYARFRYYKSADGGATWAYFGGQLYTSDSISLACPCYAVKISAKKVGVVFAARTSTNRVCYSVVDLDAFFQIPYVGWDGVTSQSPPRNILACAKKSFDTTVTSVTDSEFGYAFPVLIPNTENVLVAWYDTGDGTNLNCSIYITSAPSR
ncbi:hypothetical protein FHW84_001843 [Dyella sp. SG562]|uniref:sialidase family protein n=1 Tax=Dyella sp. SG562 TaxID=2587017 RepID=UPI001423B041|nr:sialidase family protein [Dyella sp. SG562]NII73274.1 hypothetical protein [Dyella sp. SG562]